jgi:hypothetical protein
MKRHRVGKRYKTRFVHKIAPSDKDFGPDVILSEEDAQDKKRLGKALREQGVLLAGQQVHGHRKEGGKLVAFPSKSIWHAVILTPDEDK